MYIFVCQHVHVAVKKKWTIATARQHLPELVGMAAREPQRVYRRDSLVAAVVSPALVDEIERAHRPGLSAKLAELQRLCAEDSYQLAAPARRDRANPFTARKVRSRSRKQPSPR
jgi:hypothetical protein